MKIMYGSSCVYETKTDNFLLRDNIKINSRVLTNRLLISHMPRETRIGFEVKLLDKDKKEVLVLGCAGFTIFDENGCLRSGRLNLRLWPLFHLDNRVMCVDEFDRPLQNAKHYCTISIELPKTSVPIMYTVKSLESYEHFVELRGLQGKRNEIRLLYGDSIKNLRKLRKTLSGENVENTGDDSEEEEESLWTLLDNSLKKIKDCLSIDPLSKISPQEKEAIITCRDYICTIPGALTLFLRCINWFNPLHVGLVRVYLKKWAKLPVEDAVCLLDVSFPDTTVRNHAIETLRSVTDDLVKMYFLQLNQSLFFETLYKNPLSDFLIEKSLDNPKLIGTAFFWNMRVSENHPMFAGKLRAIKTQMFMVCGPNFLSEIKNSFEVYKEFNQIASAAKQEYNKLRKSSKRKTEIKEFVKDRLKEIKVEKFTFPLHPRFYCDKFDLNGSTVFGSKMVPLCTSALSVDKNPVKVIYKIGDDLRQDVLILQILKIMDKIWLENGLDLKLTAYEVLPTGLQEGFIEFINGSVIDALQIQEGVGGAFDRELVIKHLRNKANPQDEEPKYKESNQYENFVNSLAGYCVATCVLGIGDRHLGNVMVKDNGIFYHIDYGHILGHFKEKFGVKRERAPFLLTPELAHVYNKTGMEEYFKEACCKAYIVLRRNASKFMYLLSMMGDAGLPELMGMIHVDYIRDMLSLDLKNEEDAANTFLSLIAVAKNEKFRLLDNVFHNWKHK